MRGTDTKSANQKVAGVCRSWSTEETAATIDPHFLLRRGVLAGSGFPGSWAAGGVHVTSPSQGDVDKVKHPTSRSTQNSPAVSLFCLA